MKKPAFLCLIFCVIFRLFADEYSDMDRDVPPPPVVSALTASVEGDTVTLTWTPAPDLRGTSIVLRSDRPVTAANYQSVERIAEIPYTESSYTDIPETDGTYYYAILSVDHTGSAYDFFLPASNSMLVPVSIASEQPTVPVRISDFEAVTRNDAVIVRWNSDHSGKNLVLYRSNTPFTGITSLVTAIVAATLEDDGSPFVDYPVPGIPYYYAVLEEEAIRSGTVSFTPEENTNRLPVEVSSRFSKLDRSKLPPLRSMPLPWLNPGNRIRRNPVIFSRNTERMIKNIVNMSVQSRSYERTAYLFSIDTENSTGGEELALRTILEKSFIPGHWDMAITELKRFLSIRRTPSTAARTRFYIGEAHYFSGNYDEALLEFLLSQDRYYNQSREWIQYTLEKMVSTD